jgi:hypothetical protein
VLKDPVADRIASFLVEIGIQVETCDIAGPTFLPGIEVRHGTLLIDEARLAYCGDLLHEAGHLAMLTASERMAAGPDLGTDGGAEMGAIAWSWAAALHLELDPAVVFHAHGYRGGSDALLENFRAGHYIGEPLLRWMGLTAADPPFPQMRRWLRD